MFKSLVSRFPEKQSVIHVFATAAFLVYGWTIYASFWKIPSWVYYLRLTEIFSVYAYSFLLNFAESIFLTLVLVSLGFFLTDNVWKDGFVAASVVVLVISVGSALLHMRIYEDPNLRVGFIDSQVRWWSLTLLIAFALSFICARLAWLRRLLDDLADRFVVFLYIYIPLTILSLGIVTVRIIL
jgi:hypothetical protein